jgi:hypothetical protein
MNRHFLPILSVLIVFSLLASCSPVDEGALNAARTSTAAQATVNALATQLARPTMTRTLMPTRYVPPTATATLTPLPTKTRTPLPTVVTPWNTCDVATFIKETIDDKIVMDPGTGFIKTWTIQNSGSCVWDKNYKFVFESGEPMTSTLEFSFLTGKQKVEPGEEVTIQVNLISPMQPGEYLGFWKLANAKGNRFGLTGAGDPVWVHITVDNPTIDPFKVTKAFAAAVPNNYRGSCKKGFIVTEYGKIRVNKAGTVIYRWEGTDGGAASSTETIVFYGADEQDVYRTFTIKGGIHYGYVRLHVISPNNVLTQKSTFSVECMN